MYDHSQYEVELGIPVWVAHLEDKIFEGLSREDAQSFPLEFLESIPVGVSEKTKTARTGISMCLRGTRQTANGYRWQALDDMKNSYADGLTLDRLDNTKGYYKENCRWATPAEQTRNRAITKIIEHNGKDYTIPELADEYGISHWTLRGRLNRGLSTSEAISV